MENRLHCFQASVVSGKAKSQSAFLLILYGPQEANAMTPQLIQPGNDCIDTELDQLAYSAYLLTLDPDLALSVVMAAVDAAIEDQASTHDVLQRTIEISLTQLRLNPSAVLDRESFPFEAFLYSDSGITAS